MIGKFGFVAAISGLLVVACGSNDTPPDLAGTGGSSVGGAPSGGSTPTSGGATTNGSGGTTSSTGGATTTGGTATTGGAGTTTGGSTPGGAPTVTCQQAASAYTIASVQLDAALVPHVVTSGWGASLFAQVPVAVNATSGDVYVGFTRDSGGTKQVVIVPGTSGASAPVATADNATVGGIAVTNNGFGALLFDPNDSVDARTWAAVARFDATGKATFTTDLFRSANLTDANTKGAPGTSRFAYVAATDQLVAYFGHTEMIQSVRHQGGYLATLNAAGARTIVSDWWGSHNLDQRVLVSGNQVALLGLGDAYPKGVFFAFLGNRPQTRVIYTLAGNGSGTANGQLGGLVDLDDAIAVPFITNDSISQTLTPGDWPNIDDAISSQITAAAANGNKLGLLTVPKMGTLPSGDLTPVWIEPSLGAGAHLERLKSVRYGQGGLILLAWAEVTGSSRNATRNYFTMIVDRAGAICQPKTPLVAANAYAAGDDFVRRPDGSITWANVITNRISVVTLTPGG